MSREPTFAELSAAEQEWIGAHLEHARGLGVDPSSDASIGAYVDAALERVRRGEDPPEAANVVVNVTGVLIGTYLIGRSRLRWAIVTDEFGTELCLHDSATSHTMFPQSSAAKRWESGDVGWVRPFCAWALESLPE